MRFVKKLRDAELETIFLSFHSLYVLRPGFRNHRHVRQYFQDLFNYSVSHVTFVSVMGSEGKSDHYTSTLR